VGLQVRTEAVRVRPNPAGGHVGQPGLEAGKPGIGPGQNVQHKLLHVIREIGRVSPATKAL